MNTRRLSRIGAVLLSLCAVLTIHGGGRRRALAVSPPAPALAITFIDAAAGVLETGTIVWRGAGRRSTVTTRTVRMRVGEATGQPRGNVTLRAFLETPDPRCTVRIDGVPLAAAPRVVRRNAP